MINVEEFKDFDKIMSLMSNFSNKNEKMDMFSMLDMFLPNNNQEKEVFKSNLFEERYEEDRNIKCLKCSVPFMQYNHQKNILLFIKLMEIQKLIEIYNTKEKRQCHKNDFHGMLNEIMPHIDEGGQGHIKKCLNLVSLMERVNVNERH